MCETYLAQNNILVPPAIAEASKTYYLPAKGPLAEFSSFKYQANRHKIGTKVDISDSFIAAIASNYPVGELPLLFSVPTQENFDKAFEQALCDVPRDSTPGWPLNNVFNTMEAVFEEDSNLLWLYKIGWDMFQYLLQNDITGKTSDEVFQELGVVNHLFIKDELHAAEKVEAGRYRLIFSVPILVNLMERLACSFQNKLEIIHWKDIPSKIGIGFTDEMSQDMAEYVNDNNLEMSTDMSGWDWTVIEDLIDADCNVRIKLVDGQPGCENFNVFMRNVNHLYSTKVLGLSDGTLVAQEFGGIVPSGSYRTSSSNSRMRFIARALAFNDVLAATVGDDCLEGAFGDVDPILAYAKLGLILKIAKPCTRDDFEFCSKQFLNGLPRPVDPYKLLLRYYVTKGFESLQVKYSLQGELRHCDQQYRFLL